jgi:2-keto-3-deoxy-L-fuconate dehydrogenase
MFQASKAVLPGMLKNGSGSIVNIVSIVERKKGATSLCLWRVERRNHRMHQIHRVRLRQRRHPLQRAICPGTVESLVKEDRPGRHWRFHGGAAAFTARQPIRFGTPDEMPEMVCYPAGDKVCLHDRQASLMVVVNLMDCAASASTICDP